MTAAAASAAAATAAAAAARRPAPGPDASCTAMCGDAASSVTGRTGELQQLCTWAAGTGPAAAVGCMAAGCCRQTAGATHVLLLHVLLLHVLLLQVLLLQVQGRRGEPQGRLLVVGGNSGFGLCAAHAETRAEEQQQGCGFSSVSSVMHEILLPGVLL